MPLFLHAWQSLTQINTDWQSPINASGFANYKAFDTEEGEGQHTVQSTQNSSKIITELFFVEFAFYKVK